MTKEELREIDTLAACRLSEIGFKRYMRHRIKCLRHLPMKEARASILSHIESWEARELALAHMIRVAPISSAMV